MSNPAHLYIPLRRSKSDMKEDPVQHFGVIFLAFMLGLFIYISNSWGWLHILFIVMGVSGMLPIFLLSKPVFYALIIIFLAVCIVKYIVIIFTIIVSLLGIFLILQKGYSSISGAIILGVVIFKLIN
jgi:hypothetical protein